MYFMYLLVYAFLLILFLVYNHLLSLQYSSLDIELKFKEDKK